MTAPEPDGRLVSTTCGCGATGFHACPGDRPAMTMGEVNRELGIPKAAPVQPVTLDVSDLTAIRSALIEKVHALRNHADHARGHGNHDRSVMREQAARYEDLAARLSFAAPGEPIQVVDQC